MERCNAAVDGLGVEVNHYLWVWDTLGMAYNFDTVYSFAATTSLGDLPTLSSAAGALFYKSNQLGAAEYIDPATFNIYAVFHPMTLGSPQHYSPYGTYAPWFTEFEPFNQRRMLWNMSYDLTPTILPAHSLDLSGNVIFNSGHPAVGEQVVMELNWNDPMFGWMWTRFSTTTGPAGDFTFSPPADISATDPVNINIVHPSAYWGDTWMGWIDWDPWVGSWREDLE